MAIFLDTSILGLVTHPKGGPEARNCLQWFRDNFAFGNEFYVPEIADYELRRELLLQNKTESIDRLDALVTQMAQYVPLTTPAIREASSLWAKLRKIGQPTAGAKDLDGDVILAAQAKVFLSGGASSVVIATTNVGHLSRMVDAKRWQDLPANQRH